MEITGNQEKLEALEIAEEAREKTWEYPSFVANLFMGRLRTELVFPYPEQSEEDRRVGDRYLRIVEGFLKRNLDPDEVDRTGQIPQTVIRGLVKLGCFGMKIPEEYGGLGLSQINYNRVISMIASFCGSTAVWLSAHQSIGVPQPLKLFGTPEQKKKYFPPLAKGAISAFALTEPAVGSDPAKMQATATPIEEGRYFLINGEKLWCTNGPVADLIVVMCRTPSVMIGGKEKKRITAFIVDAHTPGVEVAHRCDFMGLKGIQNGLIRFRNVRVPRENILLGEGQGLKLALTTLNTGRLTLPAACIGIAKQCLNITRRWANERVQWGAPIGRHEAVAHRISHMTAGTFAMESITWFASALADRGKSDIRIEAAMAKLFCSETGWKILSDTFEIRGGRGYETAESLKTRGETGFPVERMIRDFRINTVIEGSSEILRLFISREALDPHMQMAEPVLAPRLPWKTRWPRLVAMGEFYLKWYFSQLFFWPFWPRHSEFGRLARQIRFVDRKTHYLARTIFHCLIRYQTKLERRQQILTRIVNIGMGLFTMSASCSRALMLLRKDPANRTPLALAELYCEEERRNIQQNFCAIWNNNDTYAYRVAQKMLEGRMKWMENEIIPVGDFPETSQKTSKIFEEPRKAAS